MIEAVPAPLAVADSFNFVGSLLVIVTCVGAAGTGVRITVSVVCKNLPMVSPPGSRIFEPLTFAVTDADV